MHLTQQELAGKLLASTILNRVYCCENTLLGGQHCAMLHDVIRPERPVKRSEVWRHPCGTPRIYDVATMLVPTWAREDSRRRSATIMSEIVFLSIVWYRIPARLAGIYDTVNNYQNPQTTRPACVATTCHPEYDHLP